MPPVWVQAPAGAGPGRPGRPRSGACRRPRPSRPAVSERAAVAFGVVTTTPRIGVLALQGDVREHLAALGAGGAEGSRVRRPRELDEVDGLVIPGGESTTIDKLLRAFDLQRPLRERIAAGLPVYGSCAGMILLADRLTDAAPGQQTLGGMDILVRRNAFGRQVDSFEEDLHIRELGGEPVRAVFIRAPWVEEAGDVGRGPRPRASTVRPRVGSSPRVSGTCSPRPSTPR